MDTYWIIHLCLGILSIIDYTRGQSDVEVQLVTKKYVEKGSDVILRCVHNIDPNVLYKVAWLKNDGNIGKFFEYIADRIPPFRNFSIPGAEIDWARSNSEQVALRNLDYDAAGLYFCEVTTSTPIYTKPSQDEQIHVILPQTGPPRISFSKRHYYVDEKLVANCTTSKARPPPHITWLINGKKVDEKYVKQLHPYSSSGKNSHRSKTHQQQQQQQHQQNFQNSASINRMDSRKNLRGITDDRKEEHTLDYNFHHSYDTHHHYKNNIYNSNPFSQLTSSHEDNNNNHKTYDNKFYNTRKHRNIFNRKYRRYVNEGGISSNNGGGITTSNSGGINNKNPGIGIGSVLDLTNSKNNNNFGGSGGNSNLYSGPGTRSHRGFISSSQLNIELSELLIGNNGRLEITCLATIPAHVGNGEQFADYKTYSIKVDIEKPSEMSSPMPPMSGMAALGNVSSYGGISINYECPSSIILSTICLLILQI